MPPKKKDGIASNNLSLTQVVGLIMVQPESASGDLSLINETEVQHKLKVASNTLNLVDSVEPNNIIHLSASNTLSLNQSADSYGTKYASTENILSLVHSTRNTLHAENIEHQLDLQQSVSAGQPIYLPAATNLALLTTDEILSDAENNLLGGWGEVDPDELLDIDPYDPEQVEGLFDNKGLRQYVSLSGSIYNVTAINYLSFSQKAAEAEALSVSHHLHLSHQIEIVLYEIVEHHLYLQQQAVCHKVESTESIIELEDEAVAEGIFPRAINDQLNLRSVVSHIIIDFCDYTPGIGEGSFDYTPPPVTKPTLTRRNTTVLTWPYVSPTLTIELRNPDFDNTEQYEFRRINRRTRGGTLDLYRDEDWPKIQRLIMSFTQLSDTQRAGIFEFLVKSIGQEIGLLDFESRQWKGILLTPANMVTQPSRNGHSFSLEFEGELV